MAMFTDDTTLLSSKRKSFCSIESNMDNLSQSFCQNRLSINREECDSFAFGRCHPSDIFILEKR